MGFCVLRPENAHSAFIILIGDLISDRSIFPHFFFLIGSLDKLLNRVKVVDLEIQFDLLVCKQQLQVVLGVPGVGVTVQVSEALLELLNDLGLLVVTRKFIY